MKSKPPRIDRKTQRRIRVWRQRFYFAGRPLPKTSRQRAEVCGECGSISKWVEYGTWSWVPRKPVSYDKAFRLMRDKMAPIIRQNFERESTFLKNLSAPGGY